MGLESRYFLTWQETAQALGYDDEGLRQAMLMRFQLPGADPWLPVGIDSKGSDYLARLESNRFQNPIVTHAKVGEYHGKDMDAVLQDGTIFPNDGRTESASWCATHDHRTGWNDCYLLGGRLILYPGTVLYACESGGDLRPHTIGVAPREWCSDGFPDDGLSFALVGTDHGFRSKPEHLYEDAFFYAEDVSRVKEQMNLETKVSRAKNTGKPLDTRERTTLLVIIGALADAATLDLSQHNKAGEAVAAMLATKGVMYSGRAIGEHLKAVREAMDSRKVK